MTASCVGELQERDRSWSTDSHGEERSVNASLAISFAITARFVVFHMLMPLYSVSLPPYMGSEVIRIDALCLLARCCKSWLSTAHHRCQAFCRALYTLWCCKSRPAAFPDCLWPNADNDSVLCPVNCAVLRGLWNTSIAPPWRFRLNDCCANTNLLALSSDCVGL